MTTYTGAVDTLPIAEQIEAIYIGYFGRPADAGGLAFWEQYYVANLAQTGNVDVTLTNIANYFSTQAETIGLYPELAGSVTSLPLTGPGSITALVDQIYINLFGAVNAGASFWINLIHNGTVTLGSAIFQIANGATSGVDNTVLLDRIQVANEFSAATATAGIALNGNVTTAFITEGRDLVLSIGANGSNSTADLTDQLAEANAAITAFVANGGTTVVGPGVTFTLTLSQDTFTGYGNDTFSAPLAANSLGQELSTLQTGDSLTELSPGGVLDATFNPVITGATFSFSAFGGTVTIPLQGPNLISATIDNIGTWNLSAAAAGTYVAINGGAYVSGLTTLNMINSAAFSYIRVGVGGPGFQPLNEVVTTIDATNDALHGELQVEQLASLMTSAAAVAVTVNLNNVGSTPTEISQDNPGGYYFNSFEVSDGPNQGWINTKDGVTSWTVNSTGAANYVYLGTNGSEAATSVTFTGSAPLTVWGEGTDWSHVTAINASMMTGNLTLTGSTYDSGFLSDPASLTSLQGGSGVNMFDLSGMTLTELKAMTLLDGGVNGSTNGSTVILANDVLDGITAALPTGLTDFTNIGDAGDNGPGSDHAGTINWADLGTSATELTFYGSLDHGTLEVDNAPSTFTVNLQDNEFDHVWWSFNAANDTVGASNSITINFGCALDGDSSTHVDGNWAFTGYDSITLDATGASQSSTSGNPYEYGIASYGFTATPTPGGTIVLDITGGTAGTSFDISLGNVGTTAPGLDTADVGTTSGTSFGVAIDGGSIVGSNTGYLWLGITDATVINDSAGGNSTEGEGLYMAGPDSNTAVKLDITGSVVGFNLLQGSLGPLTKGTGGTGAGDFNSDAYVGAIGAATINGGTDGDHIFDPGGATTINLSTAAAAIGADQIFYSAFTLGDEEYPGYAVAITDNAGLYHTGLGVATINNFIPGAATVGADTDIVFFNVDSWYNGDNVGSHYNPGTDYGGISDSNLGIPAWGPVLIETVFSGGELIPLNLSGHAFDLIEFNPTIAYSSASAFETALNGAITVGNDAFLSTWSLLFAYNNGKGTEIADVQYTGATGVPGAVTNVMKVYHVQDLVDLVGVQLTTTTGGPVLTADNVHFIF